MFSYGYFVEFFFHRRDQDLGLFVTPKFMKSTNKIIEINVFNLTLLRLPAGVCSSLVRVWSRTSIMLRPGLRVGSPGDRDLSLTSLNSGCSQFPSSCLFSQILKLYFRLPILAINPYSVEHTIFPVLSENVQTYSRVRILRNMHIPTT